MALIFFIRKNYPLTTILVCTLWLLPPVVTLAADNARSDTLDITDIGIQLNVTDFTGKTISGFADISFHSKLDSISELDLDLLRLTVDSITQSNQPVAYSYNDTLLRIQLSSMMHAGDSSQVTVYYHGSPQGDASGWGGWYWSGDYAFNLGVGFSADPHPYGRIWFPCFDNFVERSTYHFFITTPDDKMATCNGMLLSSTNHGDGTVTWTWEMDQAIPSYLACVAVAPYTPSYDKYLSISGDTIPVMLAGLPADTTDMKNSFLHLHDAFNIFENHFGRYAWSKVGYTLVPFSSGSMEHASNIASPLFASNGSTTYETLFFHELSHHWFGDLVTCRTQEDMWLNEGWAVYSEKIFLENEYGEEDYRDAVASNHETAVHLAHTPLKDGQYFALNAVPHDYSYTGEGTVYDKGADVAHTLRGYMGDSLFFLCISSYLADNAYTDQSSEDLRDYLSSCSGMDLTYFFDDWVFAPGWAAFTIDSTEVNELNQGSYEVTVRLRQRLDHTTHYYSMVPLEISCYDSLRQVTTFQVMMSGACSSFTFTLPFHPAFVGLDLDDRISDAVTDDLVTVKNTGTLDLINGKLNLDIISLSDSALIRVEHVYAAPDPFKHPIANLHISQERFWKVDGIFPLPFDATATFSFNGTNTAAGYLDNNLLTNTEDSVVLLHRTTPSADWQIVSDAVINFLGSHSDKRGSIMAPHLQKGEYAFGIYQYNKLDSDLALSADSCFYSSAPLMAGGNVKSLLIFPNPANETITLQLELDMHPALLEVYNTWGRKIYYGTFSGSTEILSVKNWLPGIYFAKISDPQKEAVITGTVVIQ